MAKQIIDFKFDPSEGLAAFRNIEEKQIPFAMSLALNKTAFTARGELIKQIPKKFDYQPGFLRRNILVEQSNKKDDPIKAEVYEQTDTSMALHQFGGKKIPQKGSELVIPSKELEEQGRINSGRMRKRFWAEELLKNYKGPKRSGEMGGRGRTSRRKRKIFPIKSRKGNELIIRREAGTNRTKPTSSEKRYNRGKFNILYSKTKDANIKANLEFDSIVKEVAKNTLHKNFLFALRKAIRTAK